MQEIPQQQPTTRPSAGYRPLLPANLAKGPGTPAFAYVLAAAGMGLAVGVGIAFSAGHASAAPRVSDAFNSHSSGPSLIPAVYAAPATPLLDHVSKPKPSPESLLTPAASRSNAVKPAAHPRRHSFHRGWARVKSLGKLVARKNRKPYVSPTPAEPTGLELANSAAASGPFFTGIEGDVTIANFDTATGTIQTYEGETYVLDRTTVASNSIPWQKFPFNIHYRCDQAGDCTLKHGGATAVARLTR